MDLPHHWRRQVRRPIGPRVKYLTSRHRALYLHECTAIAIAGSVGFICVCLLLLPPFGSGKAECTAHPALVSFSMPLFSILFRVLGC